MAKTIKELAKDAHQGAIYCARYALALKAKKGYLNPKGGYMKYVRSIETVDGITEEEINEE